MTAGTKAEDSPTAAISAFGCTNVGCRIVYTLAGADIEGLIVERMPNLLIVEPCFFLDNAGAPEGDWIGGRVAIAPTAIVAVRDGRQHMN